jgi:hypothetical protein
VPADALLSTGARLQALVDQLTATLPDGVTVYRGTPVPASLTPFVVLDLSIVPARTALAGAWDQAALTLDAWSVHDTLEQAAALADLVRTWVLTGMSTAGQMDVDLDAEAREDDPGGVPQVHEAWRIAVSRS